jgi:hypothetical protein
MRGKVGPTGVPESDVGKTGGKSAISTSTEISFNLYIIE